jgi:phosphoglycolate phosphatase
LNFPIPIRSVTLDLDGTLLDTVPDLADAASAMLRELGLPPRSENDIRNFVGRGIPHLVRRCVSTGSEPGPALLEHATQVFRRHYAISNGRKAQPYPGVMTGLERLRALGLRMAVITNKAAAFTEPLLAASGIAPYIEFAVSGDSLPEKKPHPMPLLHACERLETTPQTNVHIGDSRHDAACARAAGCPVFLVPYGYNEGEDVRKLDCDAIVESLEDAAALVAAANREPPTCSTTQCKR